MSRYSFLLSVSFKKFQDRGYNSNPTTLRILYRTSSPCTILLRFLSLSEKFERQNRRLPATKSLKPLGFPLHPSDGCSGGTSFNFASHYHPSAATMQAIRHTAPGQDFVPSLYKGLKHSGNLHAELSETQFWKPHGPTPISEMVQSRQAPAFVRYSPSAVLQAIRRARPLPTTHDQFRTPDATRTPWAGISLVCYTVFKDPQWVSRWFSHSLI
jgi:hypothetical protein